MGILCKGSVSGPYTVLAKGGKPQPKCSRASQPPGPSADALL